MSEFAPPKRLQGIEKSVIRQLLDRALPGSINLGLGEPDLPTPDVIRRAAVKAIVEDDVLVGGNCGVYEGTIVRERAVLASGTILTGSTPVYDLVRGEIYQRTADGPLEIPVGAVVVPGSRAVTTERGREWGLSLYAAIIVKYRDEKTDTAVRLEDYLR